MGQLSNDQNFETFLDPKVAEYVGVLISFNKELVSEEVRLNRTKM